jgi:uncharacterized protein YkwD
MIRFHGSPRVLAAALLSLALACVLQVGSGARSALALSNCSVSDLTFDSQEQAFLTLINDYRAQNGAGPLTVSASLNQSASWMAVDLATKDYFSHTDSLGRPPSTRSANCGGPSNIGENLAAGTMADTAQEAFDMWQASSGHNQNMLYAGYKQIGIARYYDANSTYSWYWVTDFSLTNDGTNLGGETGGSGGGTAPAPPPPPPAVTNTTAQLTSPTGWWLPNTSATFSWSAGNGAEEYFLYVGTTPGANDVYGASQSTTLSRSVDGLPQGLRIIYVRLWTRFDTGWQHADYSFIGPW